MKKEIIYGCEGRGDHLSAYLTRYILFVCNLFHIYLHIFHRSDADDHHDHPWHFISIILWRGYIEETTKGKKRIYPGMILFRKATHRHRVELVSGNKKAVTLIIRSKKVRDWGFFTKDGWKWWIKYYRDNNC